MSNTLFTARDEGGNMSDAARMAQLLAVLGPPPPEFLAGNPARRADFWDEQGMLLCGTSGGYTEY